MRHHLADKLGEPIPGRSTPCCQGGLFGPLFQAVEKGGGGSSGLRRGVEKPQRLL